MIRHTTLSIVIGLFLVLEPAVGFPQEGPAPPDSRPAAEYEAVVRDFLAFHFWANPVEATELGLHDYDGRLPDMSRPGIEAKIRAYRTWLDRLTEIDRSQLTGFAYWDHEILDRAIRSRLLELEEVRGWERDPLLYNRIVAAGIALPTHRQDALPRERLRAVVQRERQIPNLLADARSNLVNPPRVFTEAAIRAFRGTRDYLRNDLPRAMEDAIRGSGGAEFTAVNRAAVMEVQRFLRWLEEDLLPRSRGDFRLGPDLFERKLRYDEHVSLGIDELLEVTRREVERYRQWIEEEARALDPDGSAESILREMGSRHPPVDSLLPLARRMVRDGRTFVERWEVLSLPPGPDPVVRAMPPYMVGRIASLDGPGPLERGGATGFYSVKLPEEGWDRTRTREHLAGLSLPALAGLTLRETFPGRYVQLLHARRAPTRVRRAFQGSLGEGWGLYAEEMAVDEGFGGVDRRFRIAQLHQVLRGLARLRAGVLMHARGLSLEEATQVFRRVAYLEDSAARMEAERGTFEPLHGYDVLGKMQVDQLRRDYRNRLLERDEEFTLGDFHDRLLELGVPLPMVRRVMIPGDLRPALR